MRSKLLLSFILFFFIRQTLFAAVPIISSFSPTSGPVGTLVTIKGNNLNNLTALIVGGVTAIVISSTGTQLVCMVMPGAMTGVVSISTSGGLFTTNNNFVLSRASYPSIQQGGALVGSNGPTARQGEAVALSADGNTAIVGGPNDNNGLGAVWIYVRVGSSWKQQGNKLVGSGVDPNFPAPSQGCSVALSADGNTAIIGGLSDSNRQGAVWIFTRTMGVWMQQGAKLVGTGSIGGANQGCSVGLSADGNTAVVGGAGDNNGQGAAWVFTRSTGVWTQQGAKLVGTGNIGGAAQGISVALSADGNTAIIGGPGDNLNAGTLPYGEGAAWIFTRNGNNWSQQGSKLVGSGNIGPAEQGFYVTLSADGKTAALVGDKDDITNSIFVPVGAIWVFVCNGNTWFQQGGKLVGSADLRGGNRSFIVTLSADGGTALIGGYGNTTKTVGASSVFSSVAWIFTRNGVNWSQLGSELIGSGNFLGASGGTTLSLDGSTAIIGSSLINGSEGAVSIFSQKSNQISAQIIPSRQNAIKYGNQQLSIAEPIQLGTGSYECSHTDFRMHTINDVFNFTRFYNSLNNSVGGPLGYGWSHSYNYHLNILRDAATQQDTLWSIQYPDGHVSAFIPDTALGQSTPLYIGTQDSLQKNPAGDFTLFTKDNHLFHFTSAGIFDQVSDLNGNATIISYAGNNLVGIASPGGRTLKFTYNGSNIISVSDLLNRNCIYTYDTSGNLQAVKDANGNTTSFSYDVNHRILSVTNSLGNIIVNNIYDTMGRIINQLDAYNQPTKIAYDTPAIGDATVTNPDNTSFIVHHDSAFRKTYIKDELGFTKTYTYDAYSNENSFTDENGSIETRQFDKIGNILIRNQPGAITTQMRYSAFNSPLQATDANGNSTLFNYDASNNLISIQFPDNTFQYFTYFPNGLKRTFKDGNGNVTAYTYSANGDLLSTTSNNATKSYTYDAAGRRITATDENNNTSTIAYDNNDNIINITDALKHTTFFTYDTTNQLTTITDKNGSTTSFTHDKKGRIISKTNANGGITKNVYDVRDNLVSVTDPNNNTIAYAYDKKGRKTAITNALGSAQTLFDGVGYAVKIIDGTNKTMSYSYSPTHKILTASDGLNNITSYAYDKNNNLLYVTNPLNKITAYSYDAMSRVVSVLDAANGNTKIAYDPAGNKKAITDPNGHTQTNTYDGANRLVAYLDAAGNTISYTYDAAGNIIKINKANGTITKTYDSFNRQISVQNSGGSNYGYTYDNNNNVTSTSSSAGASYLVYDNLNKLTQYTDPFGNKVLFDYDAAGNKQLVTYPGNKTVSYTYDNANNLKKVSDWLGHTFSYTYDAAGRITQLLYPNGVHCDYIFDAAGRLTSKNNTATGNAIIAGSTYTLDATGNRINEQKQGAVPSNLSPVSRAYAYGSDNRLLKDSVWTYLNDNAGNRASETKGQIKKTFTFSVDNRLSKLVDTTGTALSFTYDAMGHRLERAASNTVNRYVLDISGGLSQILQINDVAGAIKSQYIYGRGLLERVDSIGNILFYQYDGQHNTIALTDTKSLVTDSYTYDPFGTLLNHTGNTNQPFTFLGEFGVEQESSSLYYARERYYDALNGRFLSKDPIPDDVTNPQTLNRYSYSLDNSINRFDPSGLFSWGTFELATAQLIVGTLQFTEAALTAYFIVPETEAVSAGASGLLAAKDFNESTKSIKASIANFNNAISSNDEWAQAADQKGALDYVGFNKNFIKNAIDVAPFVSIADFPENISNLFTSFKYVGVSHFAEEAFSIELYKMLTDLKDLSEYDYSELMSALNKIHCNGL